MTRTITEQFAPALTALEQDLLTIEEKVVTGYTLADAMREGSSVSDQAYGWGSGLNACALSAAAIAGTARGYCAK